MKVWVEIEVEIEITDFTPERRGRFGDPDEPAEVEFEVVTPAEDIIRQIEDDQYVYQEVMERAANIR